MSPNDLRPFLRLLLPTAQAPGDAPQLIEHIIYDWTPDKKFVKLIGDHDNVTWREVASLQPVYILDENYNCRDTL